MNFKKISDSDLVASTKNAIGVETKATTHVVRHFREIFDRKLHLSRGYSSMFLMAVEEFGYDKASAQRRVKAMELSIAVPSVLEKIDRSEICLQSASDIQTFLDRERGTKRAYSNEQKVALVETCSGLSARKVELKLSELNPTLDFRESKKLISKDRLRITHTISTSLEEKLERIKQLRSHVNPYMTREELIDYMAELTLEAIDPIRKDHRVQKRKEQKAKQTQDKQMQNSKVEQKTTIIDASLVPAPELEKQYIEEGEIYFKEEVVSEFGEIQLVACFEKRGPTTRSRHITAEDDRKVREHNNNEGCAYVDPQTGRRCNSKHQLQRDHIKEFSKGGSNNYENLQARCAQHNRFRWNQKTMIREREIKYVA